MDETYPLPQAGLLQLKPPFSDPLRQTLFTMIKRPLSRLLRLSRLNAIYSDLTGSAGDRSFVDKLLDHLQISCAPSEADLARIPVEGPLMIVANHPFGAIEGIILTSLLRRVRPDVKIMANYFLGLVPELRETLFFVDPFGARGSAGRNAGPLKDCLRWVRDGHALGVFPAGEVSSLDLKRGRVTDPAWSPTVARMVRIAKAPVLPVYFGGGNGPLFHLLGLIHPRLRTAMLPRELLNKRDKNFSIRIGKPVPFDRLAAFSNDEELIAHLRLRTYALLDSEDTSARLALPAKRGRPTRQIVPAADPILLKAEIDRLPTEQVLVRSGQFRVVHGARSQFPTVVSEIGRLREATFRAVGEGTGKPSDLDRFDDSYVHLVLWNDERCEVVGAYRLGQSDVIFDREGIDGLYTSTLFQYGPTLIDRIGPALELGRSFVRRRYQKSYSPLLLLWRGIGRYIVLNPRYRALFGPVSISNDYRTISRELIVRSLEALSSHPDLRGLVKARNSPAFKTMRHMGCPSAATPTLEIMASLIADLEFDSKSIPVLLRQYLKLGGRILAFNRDKHFADCIDGLILVELPKTDEKTLGKYLGRQEAASYLADHAARAAVGFDRCA